MEFIGAVENINYKPITGYNAFLQGSAAFDVSEVETDFDRILKTENAKVAKNSKSEGNAMGSFMSTFENALGAGIQSVDSAKQEAERLQEALATGENVNVHDVMIAAERSSLSLNMAMQLRNKLIQAYTEINNVKV